MELFELTREQEALVVAIMAFLVGTLVYQFFKYLIRIYDSRSEE